MAIHLLDIDLYVDRLKDQVPQVKNRVEGAAELAAAIEGGAPKHMPALFVIEEASQAQANTLLNAQNQLVVFQFQIITAVRNVNDKTGASSARICREVRELTHNALLGWTPDRTAYKSTTYVGGRIIDFVGGVLWWQDTYNTSTQLRKV